MARTTYRGTLLRAGLGLIVLALLAVTAWVYAGRWEPSRTDYPVQGVSVDSSSGAIDWGTLHASHADFAYILASAGAAYRDPAFAANWAGARRVGLRYGAMHDFSLCVSAADQATIFVTTVPRDNAALPPVVRLALTQACGQRPNRDFVLASLNTFLNLIESHSGKTAVVRVSKDFNAIYDVSGGIYRTLWLDRNFLKPDYAGRPWVMWTASDMRRLDGVDGPVEWNVVVP